MGVISKFEGKFKDYVLEFNDVVEKFLQNIIDSVFGNYFVLSGIIEKDVMERKEEHQAKCIESVDDFFKMYQTVNPYHLSLELFNKSRPAQNFDSDQDLTNKVIKSVHEQVLLKVEAFIDVWTNILRLHMNTYMRHQMVVELIKNIQNNTRSTIDAKLAAGDVTGEDLDKNEEDDANFEKLKVCQEQLERVEQFVKNLANMKRVYKIQTVVKKVKKEDETQRKTTEDDIWRQKHEGQLLNQVDNDSVSQFTTDSNGKPSLRDRLKDKLKKDKKDKKDKKR